MSKILKASIVDFLFLTIAIVPIVLSMYIILINIENHQLNTIISKRVDSILGMLMIIYFVLLIGWVLLRDTFNLSPGKNVFQLTIMDRNTGMEANQYKKVIRNLPLIIFPPVEIVMKLIYPETRLGDLVANTKLKFVSK